MWTTSSSKLRAGTSFRVDVTREEQRRGLLVLALACGISATWPWAAIGPGAEAITLDTGSVTRVVPASSDPANDAVRTAVMPDEHDAADEMLRTPMGRTERWAKWPELVVLTTVMTYQPDLAQPYVATADRLTENEVDGLVADLSAALEELADSVLVRFAAVHREHVGPGQSVTVFRRHQIVAGRYRSVKAVSGALGFGGRRTRPDGTITSAAIVLDADYDRANTARRLLRAHELGHALGFNHVTSRESFMNARIGATLTDVDRRLAKHALSRVASR